MTRQGERRPGLARKRIKHRSSGGDKLAVKGLLSWWWVGRAVVPQGLRGEEAGTPEETSVVTDWLHVCGAANSTMIEDKVFATELEILTEHFE